MTGAPRNRMTLREQARVSQYMLADTDTIAQMTPADLAASINATLGIVVSDGTAARHRKGLGIAAVKPPRTAGAAGRVKLKEWIAEIEDRVAALEARIDNPLS